MKEENPKPRPGPTPDRLKIDGDWKEAVKVALAKKPAKAPATPEKRRKP